ncbi:MAG: sulfatase [Anaerolineales bacterium]|nr:sulfatase [Anaerolineales bacterium]
MKAIMVMFDSLNRRFLEPYETTTGTQTPHFLELAKRTVQFDNCYVGSMPCMPARRDLHTGRYNFLHAPWGYIEPFDDSVPRILAQAGVHTHLVSDHYHYWENAGGNYHCQYKTWEAIRGQEGDPWIAKIGGVDTPKRNTRVLSPTVNLADQDMINRTVWQDDEEKRPMYQTFSKGLEFLAENKDADNWFLTIETFDPHEPFDVPPRLKALYPDNYTGPIFDWDLYSTVTETPEEVEHLRACYKALVTYCDEQLGRVMQFMDENQMWEDTLLIVCTDHGHFLSEKGFWSKNYMPVYNELAHIPLFIWDPRNPLQGVRRQALVQTIDLPATLLDYFNLPLPADMQGRSMTPVLTHDETVRENGLFGYFGQMVGMIDEDYIFLRAAHTPDNTPLFKYTWMMHSAWDIDLDQKFEYVIYPFSKGMPVPKIPVKTQPPNEFQRHDLLFNIKTDPMQEHPINDEALTKKMCEKLTALMRQANAPDEQFIRIGLISAQD